VPSKENQLGRIGEDMKDAGQREDSVEIEKQSRQWNEKHRRAETRDGSHDLGKESDQEKQENEH
jgi:hypothetical protein